MKICQFLKYFNNWFELGISLGLHPTTLKSIENEFRNEVRCKMEMIIKWLDMSSDPQNPPSKWTLLHALKNVAKMC